MDPFEGLNFAHEALMRLRVPLGKRNSPARDCRELKESNPELKDGQCTAALTLSSVDCRSLTCSVSWNS